MGDGEASQPGLGLRTAPGRRLVADFPARAGGRAGVGGNRRGVVVRLHFHEDMGVFLAVAIFQAVRVAQEDLRLRPCDDGGVVAVGGDDAVRAAGLGVADHAEQAVRLLFPVDDPGGVENLVAAMLGIGLGEHHQLHVRRVAAQRGEAVRQIVQLVFRQRQAQLAVGGGQGFPALRQQRHMADRGGFVVAEQPPGFIFAQDNLGHAVVQQAFDGLRVGD